MATITYPPALSPPLSTLRKHFLNPQSPVTQHHLSPPITLSLPSKKTLKPTFKIQSSSTPITPSTLSPNPSPESLNSRLKNGETLYGLFLLTFSPTLAEIAALSGYDFVVVDMEHGHGSISSALPCLHALAAAQTPAILRLPESTAAWAKKALDLGPQGIMFPMIDTAKMARKAVSYCRFPPNGVRGSAHTVVRASDYGINGGYLSNYEEDLLIMCQVGDLNCWGVPPSGNPHVYVNWSNKNYFNHGDSLFFLYPPSQDSVLQVTEQAYQTCDITDPIFSMNNGNSLFNITQPGDRGVLYFISGVAGNCRNNQKLQVCIHSKGTCAYYTPPLPALAPSHSIVSGSISTAPSSSWSIQSPIKLVLAAVSLVVSALLMLFLFQKCSNSSRYAKLQQDHTF